MQERPGKKRPDTPRSEPGAWEDFRSRIEIGDTVGGRVVERTPNGAYVELAPDVFGFLKPAYIRGLTQQDYYKDRWCPIGQKVRAIVRAIDENAMLVGLSQFDLPHEYNEDLET